MSNSHTRADEVHASVHFDLKDIEGRRQKKNSKKRSCISCGKRFTPGLKCEYCCNDCKLDNKLFYSQELMQ